MFHVRFSDTTLPRRMKITNLQLFHVKPRWLFLKVSTDGGLAGWGEPIVEGKAQTTAAAVREFGRLLIGEDPRRVEHLWQMMYRGSFYRGGPVLSSAISGIEQACWDILGKSLGAPVWQLLGGRVRDKVRVYAWIRCDTDAGYRDTLKTAVREKRFTAYKMAPCVGPMRMLETPGAIKEVVKRVAEVREIAGDDVDVALDFHGRTTPAVAKILCKELEPLRPMFVEEPVLPGDIQSLHEVARSTTIPIAAGERLFTRWDFAPLIESGAVAVIQPDLSHAGGIFEGRKIAAHAEMRNVAVAPHCPLGPIALAASLQLAACTPNFLCQEHVTLGEDYLRRAFKLNGGYVDAPAGPGLGIEIDEERVRAEAFDGDWETPQWRHGDGSVAEW
jgi:galactonate dehydratase